MISWTYSVKGNTINNYILSFFVTFGYAFFVIALNFSNFLSSEAFDYLTTKKQRTRFWAFFLDFLFFEVVLISRLTGKLNQARLKR